ncbi:MAG: hypothetical protein OSJ73_10310 [Lachnospiraceae bacterium]|nr:hypothetical protein [Lachnospiraceae bacterium]
MKISQLPRPAQQVLEIIYQQHLQNNYVEKAIPYSVFSCSRNDLRAPLEILKKFKLLISYNLRGDLLMYEISAEGIILCESSAEFKTSSLLANLNVSAKQWELLNDFISEIDNLGSSVMDKKSNLKEQLIKLINEVDAEPLADVLSELLCH